jgi:RNA polymerase sigma-70 factor (ECF subfamily)
MRFDDLVRQHAADLYRYAFWLARDRSQAEDIVQEALLRGWRAYPRLRAQGAAKSWLFSIVRNEYLRAVQSAGRQPESLAGVDPADERQEHLGLEMREALLSLPASYAEPLALQVLGGFSCAEIAAMLGSTEGATMTRLTRARQALKRLVAPGGTKERKGGRS